MALSSVYIEKAKVELGEDEEKREECLRLFKKFLQNHPFIKSSRDDDTFLLQFLRIRKFNLDNTFKSFENYYMFRRKYSDWIISEEEDLKRTWELFNTGYAYPLKERDAEHKKVIFIQVRKFDTTKYNSSDAIRLLIFIAAVLIEEEETQISGVASITDYTDASYQYFNLFSINDIKNLAQMAKVAAVGREKENYFVKLPPFASFLFEIGKKALNEKLRKRLILTRNMEELKRNHVNAKILPKECGGGDVSESEMLDDFRALHSRHEKNLRKILDYEIDWEAAGAKERCSIM